MSRTKEQRDGYLSLQLRAHAPKQLLISSLEAGAQQGVGWWGAEGRKMERNMLASFSMFMMVHVMMFFCHYAWLIDVHRLGNLVVGSAETCVVLVQSQQQNRSCNKLLKQNKTKTNYYNYSGKLHWIPPSSKNWVWNWNIFVKQCANGGCDSWSTSAYNHTWSCMDARTTTNCGDEKTTTIIQKWTQLHPRNKLGLMFVG